MKRLIKHKNRYINQEKRFTKKYFTWNLHVTQDCCNIYCVMLELDVQTTIWGQLILFKETLVVLEQKIGIKQFHFWAVSIGLSMNNIAMMCLISTLINNKQQQYKERTTLQWSTNTQRCFYWCLVNHQKLWQRWKRERVKWGPWPDFHLVCSPHIYL